MEHSSAGPIGGKVVNHVMILFLIRVRLVVEIQIDGLFSERANG
jgi:hypothetical protein